jgi:hypothetical protein
MVAVMPGWRERQRRLSAGTLPADVLQERGKNAEAKILLLKANFPNWRELGNSHSVSRNLAEHERVCIETIEILIDQGVKPLFGCGQLAASPPEPTIELPNQRSRNEKELAKGLAARRPNQHTRKLTTHEEKIWQIIQTHAKGRGYARALDAADAKPPWIDLGCPSTYLAAFDQTGGHWRQRLQNEKSKVQAKALALLAR